MTDKVLFITLTNIGDVFLTLPALDYLRAILPETSVTVMVPQRPAEIFENNPGISKLIVYDKHSGLSKKLKLFSGLKKERFDIVIDLRNSFFGALLPARYKNSPFLAIPKNITHMKDRHLYKVQSSKFKVQSEIQSPSLYISPEDERYTQDILKTNGIRSEDKIIVVAAGARSHIKRWPKDKFADLTPVLIKEFGAKIILVGDKDDTPVNKYIAGHVAYPIVDLTAKTNIAQLACLLGKAALLVTNDSAVLHIASYLNKPIVAIFGPTDEKKYGPWSDNSVAVRKEIFCRPCQKAQCRFGTLECMSLVKVEDVIKAVREVLADTQRTTHNVQQNDFKRILIVRTDRIGDVLLSTPVIKALRLTFPNAYIAMMVNPYAKDIVEGNPYLDSVITYDKDAKHKSWPRSLKFALNLKKRKFDLAIILHPTNRAHLVTFLAGIPKRVGYQHKCGFLLTDKVKHTKQLGEAHESEYALDLVRYLGIEPKSKRSPCAQGLGKDLFMPIRPDSEKWVEDLFRTKGITDADMLLAIHPGASCPSKIWPNERFAEVADRLTERYGFKVLVVSGPKDISLAQNAINKMRHAAINLAGMTSVSQLASVLKRCQLFISNDSGPVHIASSVGTPVISIFGRNQEGLSPKRWGPLGKKDKVIRKETGCIKCLAHNCLKEFACLKGISVEDVLRAADSVLNDKA